MLIQIILLLALALALALTWRRFRQQAIGRVATLAWSLVWLVAAAAVIRPETTTIAARFVGVGRGVDLAVYSSVVALLILVFQLHVSHHRLERSLTELVRQQALHAWEEERKQIK